MCSICSNHMSEGSEAANQIKGWSGTIVVDLYLTREDLGYIRTSLLALFCFSHPQSPLYFATPSTQIQVSQNLLTTISDARHHQQESLLPSVCLMTLTILPLLLSPFPKVLILELITITGGLLVAWFTRSNIPMFDTSVNITFSSALPLHPSTLFSAQDPINLTFSIQITVTLSW